MLETAFAEPELLAGAEHLGHEAQTVLSVEPGGLARVDGAHLADEAVAQGVQARDGGLLVALLDRDGQGLHGAGVAADGFELALGEPVVVEPVVVEAVAPLVHHHVGEDLAHAARTRVGGDLHALAGLEAVDELGPPVDDLHLVGFRAQLVVDVMEEDGGAPPSVTQAGDPVAQHRVVADELFDALRQVRRLPPALLGPGLGRGRVAGLLLAEQLLTFP